MPAAWDRTWTLAGRGRVRLDFAIDTGLPPTCRWVVPGVMVDGNRAGQGAFPRGGPEVGWALTSAPPGSSEGPLG